jgi:uncharacterized protein DUF2442
MLGMKLNNAPPPDVTAIRITRQRLTFELEDGRTASAPLAFYPTLLRANPTERAAFEICHSSVHWPKLACDIGSACLLPGAREARRFAAKALKRRSELAAA